MKRKYLFALMILILSFCACLGYVNLHNDQDSVTYAASSGASVWDGESTAWDATTSQSKSQTDYYRVDSDPLTRYIYTAAGFKAFADEVNSGWVGIDSTVYLDTDIDLNNNEWITISEFKGTFDGQGHTIFNLKISDVPSTTKYVGLFGQLSGRVHNVRLENVDICVSLTGASGDLTCVGAIAGIAGNKTAGDNIINNCFVSGNITNTNATNIGGIVGAVRLVTPDNTGKISCNNSIRNVKSSIKIKYGQNVNVGGIAGYFLGNELSNAAFDGEIQNASVSYVGGLIGCADTNNNSLSLVNVYTSGTLYSTESSQLGGLIGKSVVGFTTNILRYAYNAASVVVTNNDGYAGGLFGYVGSSDAYRISNVFNAGQVGLGTGTKQSISFRDDAAAKKENLLFYQNKSKNESSMLLTNVYCEGDPYETQSAKGETLILSIADYARTKGFYTTQNWNFDNNWMMSNYTGEGYPYLKVLEGYGYANSDFSLSAGDGLAGEGTFENPYQIRTAGDLAFLSFKFDKLNPLNVLDDDINNYVGKYYVLQNDIDLSSRTWTPIGNSRTLSTGSGYALDLRAKFSGVFDGNGHTISGISTSMQTSYGCYGLFGATDGAVIKNLIVKDVRYLTEGDNSGAIVGHADNTQLINCVYMDSKDYKAVGASSVDKYLYKGKLNFTYSETDKLSEDESIVAGYDVEVDANGGMLYRTTGDVEVTVGSAGQEQVVAGEYHVLYDLNGNIITSGIRDEFFQRFESLPTTYSEAINKAENGEQQSFVINEGYKLTGYTTQGGSFATGKLTLYATYEAMRVKVRLIYNAYEQVVYDAERNDIGEIMLPYDGILANFWNHTREDLLSTRGSFDLEGVYFRFNEDDVFNNDENDGFQDRVESKWDLRLTDNEKNGYTNNGIDEDSEGTFCDGYYLYAKWKGKEDLSTPFKVTLILDKPPVTEADDYIGKANFNIVDAVKSLKLITYAGEEILPDDSVIGTRNEFTISTTLNSDNFDKFYRFELELNDGYRITDGTISFVEKDYADAYSDYGKLTLNTRGMHNRNIPVGAANAEDCLDRFNNTEMRNLYGDYEVTVRLQRANYSGNLKIASGANEKIYFAVAPAITADGEFGPLDITSGQLFINGTGYEKLPFVMPDGTTYRPVLDGTFVGYDIENQVIITSVDSLGIYRCNANGNSFAFSFNGREFKYVKNADSIILYEMKNGRNIDVIVKLWLPTAEENYYRYEYFHNANFVFLFTTEDESVTFKATRDGHIPSVEYFWGEGLYGSGVNYDEAPFSKEAMYFKNVAKLDDVIYRGLFDESKMLEAITRRTQLTFNYTVVSEFDWETAIPQPIDTSKEIAGRLSNTRVYVEEGTTNVFGFSFESDELYELRSSTPETLIGTNVFVREVLIDRTTGEKYYSQFFNNLNIASWQQDLDNPNKWTLLINVDANMRVGDDTDAHTGIFEVIIVPDKVRYNLGCAAAKIVAGEIKTSDELQDITVELLTNPVYYDSQLTFRAYSPAGDNSYIFIGWHDGTHFLDYVNSGASSTHFEYTTTYSNLVRNGNVETVYAIYKVKGYTINLYSGYVFDDDDETLDYEKTLVTNLGINVAMSVGNDSVTFSRLSGQNGNGFFIKGYRLYLLRDGYTKLTDAGASDFGDRTEVLQFASIVDYANRHLLEDTEAFEQSNYYVLPVVARKTAKLIFMPGAEGVEPNPDEIDDENYRGQYGDVIDITNVLSAYQAKYGYTRGNLVGYTTRAKSQFVKTINSESIYLDNQLFVNYTNDVDVVTYFEVQWTANKYQVTFDSNGGEYVGMDTTIIEIDFDGGFRKAIPASSDFVKSGYRLKGWSFNGEMIIENDNILDDTSLFSNGKYSYANDVTLVAVWQENIYQVAVHTNGANAYYYNGVLVEDIANELTNFEIYNIEYESSLQQILDDYSNDRIPTRDNFVFAGLYTSSEAMSTDRRVNSMTRLLNSLPGVDLLEEIVLHIYVGWNFDYNSIMLPISGSQTKVLNYTGQDITVSAGEYLTDDTPVGLIVSYDGTTLDVSTLADSHTEAKFFIEEVETSDFFVRDAGLSMASLTFIVEDQAEFLNLGNVISNTYGLSVQVVKAEINTANAIRLDVVKLANIKKMVEPFVTSDIATQIDSCQTFSSFTNAYKQIDNTIIGRSDDDVYDYLMTKYYLFITNNNISYKMWTYSDFATYRTEHSETVAEILNNLLYFDYYIYGENAQRRAILGYEDSFVVSSEYVVPEILASEISIETYKLVAPYVDEIAPNTRYALRVYLMDTGALENYVVSSDEEGKYIEIGQIYIVPQIWIVDNIVGSTQTYYNDNITKLNISWSEGRESKTYSSTEYYKIGNGLYLSANLTTSNIGSASEDREYNFFNDNNVLYFENQKVISVTGEEISGVDRYFKCILPEDYTYKILNITSIAEVNITAKYLTDDGYVQIADIDFVSEALHFAYIVYDIGAGEKVLDEISVEPGVIVVNGITIGEIRRNLDNSISMIASTAIKRIAVATKEGGGAISSAPEYKYIRLYKWADSLVDSIDGSMEENGIFEISTSNLDFSKVEATNFYAIYTDLVLINYNLNFPYGYTPSSITSTTARLGVDTKETWFRPYENGFELSSMTVDSFNISYDELFDEDDVFIGLSRYSSAHAPITLNVKWNIEDIEYEQIFEGGSYRVGSFDMIFYNDVVNILNINNNLFTYTYEWLFNDSLVSDGQMLTFVESGLTSASGEYTLKVIATIRDEYIGAVDAGGGQSELNVTFNMNFMANRVTSIYFTDENEVTYNGQDNINVWYMLVSYNVFNGEEYVDGGSNVVYYTESGVVSHVVKKNSVAVTRMVDAGTYSIEAVLNPDYYVLDDENIDTTFTFTILPYTFDLKDIEISFTKKFNEIEPVLTKDISTGIDNVIFAFERTGGEDVGEYELYLASISEELKYNYIITMDDVEIFKDGAVLEDEVAVGTFKIITAGLLKLYYQTTAALSENLTVVYDEQGYTANLTNQFKLQIYCGDSVAKEVSLILFDVDNNQIVSGDTLNILKSISNDLDIKFFTTQVVNKAENQSAYAYYVDVGSEFLKRYSNVAFENGYQFVITKKPVEVGSFVVDKVYNGKLVENFDLQGNLINDVTQFDGVYVKATYADAHVGTNIRVDFELVATGAQELSNYELSANSALATISKLQAIYSVDTTETSYIYGQVSETNFVDCLTDASIVTTNNQHVEDLLVAGYYTLSYKLPNNTSANANGYIYAGSYAVSVDADFVDFNMTFNLPTIVITQKQVAHNMSAAMFRKVVTNVTTGPYVENYTIAETGDVLTLNYYVYGKAPGDTFDVGFYDLELPQNVFANNSILITIAADNDGLQVLPATNIVYMIIDDTTILNQTYNSDSFEFSVDTAQSRLYITNNSTTVYSDIKFESEGALITIDDFTEEEIYYADEQTSFTSAGNYKLSLKAVSNSFPNIIFKQEYVFVIAQQIINVNDLDISKEYDGENTLSIEISDNAFILAKFNNAGVGASKPVTLSLSGSEASNYVLSTTSTTGEIAKAQVILSLTKSRYTYGQFTQTDKLNYVVTRDDVNVSVNDYTINSITIIDATYSASWNYLDAGVYDLALSYQSDYYVISIASGTQLIIDCYDLRVEFNESGKVVARYGTEETLTNTFVIAYRTPLFEDISLTIIREPGSGIGYYKAVSATTTSTNYIIDQDNVKDNTEGVYRIIKSTETIYLLMTDAETISSGQERVSYVYNGLSYTSARIDFNDMGGYKLVLSDGTHDKEFTLYTYVYEGGAYTRVNVDVQDLTAQVEFENFTTIRNVADYTISISNANALNYEVSLTRYGEIYNYIQVTKKDLYFRNSVLSKVFDNTNATFLYEDATELLEGIVEGDNLGLSVEYQNAGEAVKYVGNGYDVVAHLEGDIADIANYNLNLTTQAGVDVVANIIKAELTIFMNDQEYTYGEEFSLEPNIETDVDLTGYDTTRIDISLSLIGETFSTANKLNVASYAINLVYNLSDFEARILYNGRLIANYNNNAKVKIKPKTLTYQATSGTLDEIFTKEYDANATCDTTNLALIGIEKSEMEVFDDVEILSASFENVNVGKTIKVLFILTGDDAANYDVALWQYGVIKPVVVNLAFDYNAGGDSNVRSSVERAGLTQINKLAFPFVSLANISANSYDEETAYTDNFPVNLYGYAGHTFMKWTLRIPNIEAGSEKLAILEAKAEEFGLPYTYGDNTFTFKVANKPGTASLLNYFISGDEDNLFGMHFAENDDITITFVAEWDIQACTISITIEDENGQEQSLGAVTVNGEEYGIKKNFTFDYDETITIVASANPHATYYGFYDNSGRSYDGAGIPGIAVSRDGDNYVLQILHVTTDYGVHVRFKEQRVTIVVDISEAPDATVDRAGFVKVGDTFTATEKYLDIADVTLSELQITRLGYALETISCGGVTIDAADLDTETLASFVSGSNDVTITFIPTFVAVGVVVTLDYCYEDITRQISVAYDSAYGSSPQWIETPEREGYSFVGWHDEDGFVVNGETMMTKTESHTLYAQWEIEDYTFAFEMNNATIYADGETISNLSKTLTFGQTYTFEVSANVGYSLPTSNWDEILDVSISGNVATVSITMPGREVEINMEADAKLNKISISGNRIDNIVVYEIGEDTREVEKTSGKYEVYTGTHLRIVLTAQYGYQFTEQVDVNVEGLVIENVREDDSMTLGIDNFTSDFNITLYTEESKFDVSVGFDDAEKIDHVIINTRKYASLTDLTFSVKRGETLDVYVMYQHGYEYSTFDTSANYDVVSSIVELADDEYTKLEISNIERNGLVIFTTKLKKYTLTLVVVSYNENQEEEYIPENRAMIVSKTPPVIEDYGTVVTLMSLRTEENYNFAGWSKDKINVFSTDYRLDYTIEETETIYAIYSATKFRITFGVYNLYSLYSEYQDESKTEVVYEEISDVGEGFYSDAELHKSVRILEIFYGANKAIYFKVPDGYNYFGFGYNDGDTFKFIGGDDVTDRVVDMLLSTSDLDTDNLNMKIYAVVKAQSATISVGTQIDTDGYIEQNVDVGSVKLVAGNGDDVNIYGYVDGTRVHYSAQDYRDGELIDGKHFDVIAYTGEEMYIKVLIEKEGYKLDRVETTLGEIVCVDQENNIYKISNIIGGQVVDVMVTFRPVLNKIDIKFQTDVAVEAGAFDFVTTDIRKVFSGGTGYSVLNISAYTDSSFTVFAYIGFGYKVDLSNIEIVDEHGLVDLNSIRTMSMSQTDTGFSARISFHVSNYLGNNSISVKVRPRTYTAKLYDDDILLVEIRNVEYDKLIDISSDNADNITIYDERIAFESGRLNLKIQKTNFNFDGYFSYENGAGIRYINSDGVADKMWKESGYYYNTGSSKYEMTDNATLNELTGEMEISLYLYMSYNKTRITFELVPTFISNITAQDMVSGVDYTNSWFYESAPYYIEIAYNTPVKIVAPELDGYKFYKFVISQRDIHGNWLTDVVSYSPSIPWETNELDSIVECKIKVSYFALVSVVTYGGDGEYVLNQQGDDSQAQQLIAQNYVDTTKVFSLQSIPAAGYEFVRWNNITSSRYSSDELWDGLFITQKTTFVMNLQGKSVTLKFSNIGANEEEVPYDATYGQIVSVTATSINGKTQTTILGSYRGDTFNRTKHSAEVRVGDSVVFNVGLARGYGIIWGRDDITYDSYTGERYLFKMTITPDMVAEQPIRINPEFKDEVISIFFNRDFAPDQKGHDAVDQDNVDFAGHVLYQDRIVDSITISRTGEATLKLVVNAMYEISAIKLSNYDREFDMFEKYVDGRLQISQEFISENQISGVISLKILFVRSLWKDKEIDINLSGNGTEEDPYLIATAEELARMMQLVNSGAQNADGLYYYEASYKLTNSIELGANFWTPIGTNEFAFNGKFNFNGHLVTLIYLPFNFSPTSYGGLFGVLGSDAEIIANTADVWYWYLVGALGAGLIATTASLIVLSKKRKKRRAQMSVK